MAAPHCGAVWTALQMGRAVKGTGMEQEKPLLMLA